MLLAGMATTSVNGWELGAGSDLRDRLTFPTFADCPGDHELDPRYYTEVSNTVAQYSRHWCSLSQIVSVENFTRLVLNVRDMAGRDLRVACYDDRRGAKFIQDAKPGRTVAVLCGLKHHFMDGSFGFRVEEDDEMAIIPHGLQNLQAANNALWGPPAVLCPAPGCKKKGSKTCTGCHLVRYCSKDHQVEHWAAHKGMCKALPALKLFTNKDWTVYDDGFAFR